MADSADRCQKADEELLRRIYCGDRKALSDLVKRYYDLVWRFVYAIAKNYQDTDDACQQAFKTLITRINNRDYTIKNGGLRPYLFRTAQNKLIDIYRKDGRAKQAIKEGKINPPGDSPNPVESLKAAEIQKIIKSTLLKFPEKKQKALELYYSHPPKTFREIGEILGVSLGTARNYVKEILNKLREILGEGEIDYV